MIMKLFPTLLVSLAILTGCSSGYDITLSNGNRITGVSKPRLNKETSMYEFKDAAGHPQSVHSMRVRQIGPHGDSDLDPGSFKAPSRR